MKRRDFTMSLLASALGAAVGGSILPRQAHAQEASQELDDSCLPHISFLLYDGMTALDLIGPAEVLAEEPFIVDYVSRDKKPVYAESRTGKKLGLLPTATFADITSTTILCIPGTSNPYTQIMQDDMVEWIAAVGQKAEWVTSVCTGSFLLGAAGLLKGYKATTHWTVLNELTYFGATPVGERVVHDRNRVTGAGVTSGIDFGLVLLSLLEGEKTANIKQLLLEYDPAPPFTSGSPKTADPSLVEEVKARYERYVKNSMPQARESLERAAKRLGVGA